MYSSSMFFEDILEFCIVAMRENGKSVEDCLANFPTYRAELEPLLNLATRLQKVPVIHAPDEFRHVALTRMNNLVSSRPRNLGPRNSGHISVKPSIQRSQQKRLPLGRLFPGFAPGVAVLAVLFLSILMSGAVYASGSALPGDFLYPAKVTVENARLALSWSDQGDTELRMFFANNRLFEVSKLLEEKNNKEIGEVLVNYNYQVKAILTVLVAEARLTPEDQADLAELFAAQLAKDEEQLNLFMERAPLDVLPVIRTALEVSTGGRKQALQILSRFPERFEELPAGWPGFGPQATPTPSPPDQPVETKGAWPAGLPTLPAWLTELPEEWETPFPPDTQIEIPEDWPTDWPEDWSTELPEGDEWSTEVPGDWPTDWPDDWSTEVPEDWPTDWPEDWSTELPEGWSTDWPQDWSTEEPEGWPTDWPEEPAWPDDFPNPEETPRPWVDPTGLPPGFGDWDPEDPLDPEFPAPPSWPEDSGPP